jgi:mRNA interferase MazF
LITSQAVREGRLKQVLVESHVAEPVPLSAIYPQGCHRIPWCVSFLTRPAVIVQTDAFPGNHASVVVCQLTSELVYAPDFRVTIEPGPENGLWLKSQVMADKPVTIRRERIGQKIGHLGKQDMARLGIALAFVLGLAD